MTSLNSGEGLAAGLMGEVGGREGERECGGGRRERANINCDAVDVQLKLRSSLKIAFDMNARKADNKIKSCISLKLF